MSTYSDDATVGCCKCVLQLEDFEEKRDPRPSRSCLCCVPRCYVQPGNCERRHGRFIYFLCGATMVRWILKHSCYRWLRPLAKTQRGTPDRRRALVQLLPMFIGIEIGHLCGGLVHLAGVVVGQFIATSDRSSDATASMVLQLVLIYCVHVVPLCVQRLNRLEAYNALFPHQCLPVPPPPPPLERRLSP
jgi:hypothetical protein